MGRTLHLSAAGADEAGGGRRRRRGPGRGIRRGHHPSLYSLYAHLDSFAHIKLGSAVSSDTVIGYADSTGKSTGDHLHLELRIMSATPSGKFSYSGNIYTTPNYIAKSLAGDDYAAY